MKYTLFTKKNLLHHFITLKDRLKQWQLEKKSLSKVFKKVLEEKKRLDKSGIDYNTVSSSIFFDYSKYKILTELISDNDPDFVMKSELSKILLILNF